MILHLSELSQIICNKSSCFVVIDAQADSTESISIEYGLVKYSSGLL